MIGLARCGKLLYWIFLCFLLLPGDGMDWDVHRDQVDELHKVQRTPYLQEGLPAQPSFNVHRQPRNKIYIQAFFNNELFFYPRPADSIHDCVGVLKGKNDPNKEKIILIKIPSPL